jgi:3D (Asp-Asp-Asp) domain-containing protein
LENDPVHQNAPFVTARGIPNSKLYRSTFLEGVCPGVNYVCGVIMQGTGIDRDGGYIKYLAGADVFELGMGGAYGPPRAWETVAVDPAVIPPRAKLHIRSYPDKGPFEALDVGGGIKGNHIDVFAGSITVVEAGRLAQNGYSEVCVMG